MPFHRALPLAAVLAVAGCASVDRFGDRALAYNDQIASAQNRMLFLNVVRAAYKHPMAFTSISGVSGSANISGSLGFGLPFAANPQIDPFSASPQLSASGGPTFTISNLDTQEFMKGVLTPVGVQTIDLFGQQGLPWQELYDLFIGEVAITDGAGATVARLYNTPSTWGSHAQRKADFQAFLAVLHDAEVRTEEVGTPEPVGLPIEAKDLRSVDGAAKIDAAGYTARPAGGDLYQLEKLTVTHRFCVGNPATTALTLHAEGRDFPFAVTPAMRCGAKQARAAADAPPAGAAGGATRLLGASRENAYRLDIDLRSAEGVTYYLGEVMRQELCLDGARSCSPGGVPPILVQGNGPADPVDPLLVAVRGASGPRDLVQVRYLGETFSLPGGPGDRSAQVLAILGQLVNLNKSAKDTPAPSIVTLVGR